MHSSRIQKRSMQKKVMEDAKRIFEISCRLRRLLSPKKSRIRRLVSPKKNIPIKVTDVS